MKTFFVMMLFVCVAKSAVLLSEELEKGLPEYKMDFEDRDDEIFMKALPELRDATDSHKHEEGDDHEEHHHGHDDERSSPPIDPDVPEIPEVPEIPDPSDYLPDPSDYPGFPGPVDQVPGPFA